MSQAQDQEDLRARMSESSTPASAVGPVAYLMSHYPAISHAFILREVEQLRRSGLEVHTISIHATDKRNLLADADRREHERTFNVLPTGVGRLGAAHLAALTAAPLAYLRTLLFALRASPPGMRDRLWRLFYFAEAMLVWQHCRAVGARHIHAQFADVATDVAMLTAHFEQLRGGSGVACSWSLAVHGPVEFYNVDRYALPRKLEHARFALAISDFGRSQLMNMTARERWSHIHVVHCGVDPNVYEPVAKAAEAGEGDETTVLYVGRLVVKKGLSVLLTALQALIAEGRRVRLVVIGEGEARAEFEAQARELGLSAHVDFEGAVGQDDIRDYYAAADIFCLPSFAEGIPVVLMEAMAMETAVVSTTIMGIPELIEHERNGLLVAPGRADLLAEALKRLVESPELRRELGTAARVKVCSDFDVLVAGRQLRDIFKRELSSTNSRCHSS